jgi:MFS family permease
MAPRPAGRSRPYYLLALLCLMAVFAILDRQVMTVLVQPIRHDLKISDLQFGLLQGVAFGVFYAVLGVPIAYFADRGDRRKLIAAGLVVWSVMTIAGGLAGSFTMLFVFRMFVGIGEASFNPAAYSLIGDSFPPRRLSRAMGLMAGAFVMSTGLSVFVTGWLAAWLAAHPPTFAPLAGLAPWRLTILAIALPAPLLGLLLLATTREPPRLGDGAGAAPPLRAVWAELVGRRGLLLLVILGVAASNVHINAQLSWFPAYLIRRFGYSIRQVGLEFGGITLLAGLLGPLLGGLAADALHRRLGVKAPVVILIFVTCGAFVQAAAPLAPTAQAAILAFGLGYMVLTASMGLAPALIQMVCSQRVRGRMSGIYIAASNLAGLGLGPVLVPLLAQRLGGGAVGLGHAISLASTLMLLIALALFLAAFLTLRGGPAIVREPQAGDIDYGSAPVGPAAAKGHANG